MPIPPKTLDDAGEFEHQVEALQKELAEWTTGGSYPPDDGGTDAIFVAGRVVQKKPSA